MKQLPNILTALRLVLSVLLFVDLAAVAADFWGGTIPEATAVWMGRFTFIAFVVAALTDFFDGWLARRFGATSLTGAILDPIADKILVCGAILGLAAIREPGVLIPGGLILFREFSVSALREVLAPRGITLPVTFLAKIKTTLQLVALAALLFLAFWPVWGIDATVVQLQKAMQVADILFAIAAGVTVWTGLDYARSAMRALEAPMPSPPVGEGGPHGEAMGG